MLVYRWQSFLGSPTCLPRGGRTCKLITKLVPSYFYNSPLRILVGIREVRNKPNSAVPNLEVIAFAEAIAVTIQKVYVILGKP